MVLLGGLVRRGGGERDVGVLVSVLVVRLRGGVLIVYKVAGIRILAFRTQRTKRPRVPQRAVMDRLLELVLVPPRPALVVPR